MPANHPADAITIENFLEIFFSKFRASSNSFFFFLKGIETVEMKNFTCIILRNKFSATIIRRDDSTRFHSFDRLIQF